MAKYVVYTSKGARTKELDTLNDAKKNALGLAMASTDLVTIAYGNNPFATMKRDSKGIKYTSIATKQSHYLDVPGASKATAPKATVAKKTVAKAPVKKAVKKVETGKFTVGDFHTPNIKSRIYSTLDEARKVILDDMFAKGNTWGDYVYKDGVKLGHIYKYRTSPNPMWSAEDRKTPVALNRDGTVLKREYVRKTPKPVGPQHNVKLGDVFYSSWGYDQTNVDWFQVVGVTDSGVYIRPIYGSTLSSDGYGSDKVVPAIGKFMDRESLGIEPTVKGSFKRVLYTNKEKKGAPYLNMTSFANAYLWDGKPKRETSFGWGH